MITFPMSPNLIGSVGILYLKTPEKQSRGFVNIHGMRGFEISKNIHLVIQIKLDMTRPNLVDVKDWVIVTEKSVYQFKTFHEALEGTKILKGHLMTKTYYDLHHTKKE